MKRLFLTLTAIAACCLPASAQISISLNSGTIINSSPIHAGINLGIPDGYDSSQICKNLIGCGENPGFEPARQQQIYTVNASASPLSTTQVNSNENNTQYDGVPLNWWAGGTLQIRQPGAAPGSDTLCTSTISANTVTAPPSPQGPIYSFAACASAPVVGNVFTLSTLISPTPTLQWGCTGGGCSSNTSDLCTACGTQTIQYNGASTASVRAYGFDAGGNINFYVLINGTYQMSYWAKAASGSPTITTTLARSGGSFTCTMSDTLTTTWTQYTHNCTGSETGTGTPGGVVFTTSVSGGVAYEDNVDFEKTSGLISGNTSRYRDEVYTAVKTMAQNNANSTASTCRYGAQTGTLDDFTQTEFTRPATNVGLQYSGFIQQPTMGMFLDFAKAVGCDPVFIMPITFTTAEIQGFMDYLGGDGTTFYGAKRIAQGQTTRWTSVFPVIHVEIGNENWNGAFAGTVVTFRSGAPSTYYDYMKYAGTLLTAARAQPSYVSNIKFVVTTLQNNGGQATSTEIGYVNPDEIEINGYLANSISDTSTTALLWAPTITSAWVHGNSSTDTDGFYQNTLIYNAYTNCGPSHTANCSTHVYEMNMNTYQGSISQATLDTFVDAAGAGLTMFDQVLEDVTHGIGFHNAYQLGQYYFNANSFNAHMWGTAVDYGGATNLYRPQGLALRLANTCMVGSEFSATIASPDTYNLPSNNNSVAAVTNVPAESAYAFTDGAGNYALCLVNRDVTNSHTVTFTGTGIPTNGSTVSQTRMNYASLGSINEATGLSATNAVSAAVTLGTTSLTSFNPATAYTLPAGSATLLSYAIITVNAPTFSPVAGTYSSAQTVTMTSSTGGAAIYYTLDGSTPTTSSTLYTGAITISSTTTVKALANLSGNSSSVTTGVYTITGGAVSNAVIGGSVVVSGSVVIQ